MIDDNRLVSVFNDVISPATVDQMTGGISFDA